MEARRTRADLEGDLGIGLWLKADLPEPVWATCADLARRHGPILGVRALDSLHVAAALELRSRSFWTFDDRQARLAQAVGLQTS
jgi:predicted nucleic acid-binding protein